jgi:serine/threonine protein kinase
MRNREITSPFAPAASEVMASLWESGLLPGEELRRLSAERVTDDGAAWIDFLTRRGVLTPFQAEQLLAGNSDRLVLGGYRILERLGEGGMGQVFRAEHQLMKRVVALKVIAGDPFAAGQAWEDSSTNVDICLPHTTNLSPDELAAFHREVRAAGRLRHPNIVTAYDAAEDRGVHFLAMEFVPGIDLGRLIRESGPLPVALACEYIRQAALGLQYAYEQGVVHRDVKPSNLLLTWEGIGADRRATMMADRYVVKLLDLGLARIGGRPMDEGDLDGTLCGTPDFLAPELAMDSRIVDIRADLYSLGCTFYYLLTGHAPYPGGTWTEKLVRHRTDAAPPLATFRTDVPDDVSAILDRLRAKDPAQRFQLPADLVAALPEASETPSYSAPPLPVSRPESAVRTPDFNVDGTWPTLDNLDLPHLVAEPQSPVSQASGFRSALAAFKRKAFISTIALAASAFLGLVLAWAARQAEEPEPVRTNAPVAAISGQKKANTTPAPPSFEVRDTSYVTLTEAIQKANDGDTVTIHGDGPIPTPPMSLRDKALTLQAAPGGRPCLNLTPSAEPRPRQSLLSANRPLTVVGLDLAYEPPAGKKAPREPIHLIYCENAAVRLLDCRFTAPKLAAPIVARQCPIVELRDCKLRAAASGLCIELGEGSACEITLTGNGIAIQQEAGAAVTLWAEDSCRPAPPRLVTEHNKIVAGRILSWPGPNVRPEVTFHANEVAFRQAMISHSGPIEPCPFVWHGRDNVFQPTAEWVSIDGKPADVHGLDAWRAFCRDEEIGSRER